MKRKKVVPWEHQIECLASITSARRRQCIAALFVMASGLGKTFTSAFDFRRFRRLHPNARILFLAHQNDLLEQAEISYRRIFGNAVTYGFFNGHKKETRANVTFATFQSMQQALFAKKRTGRRLFGSRRFDYIVVDESHHGQAPTYREVIDYFRPKFLLGMTATPDRMDMVDIRDIFCKDEEDKKEVFSLDLEEALTRGLLTPVDYRIMADEIVDKGEIDIPPHLVTIKKLNRIFFARKRDEEIVETILTKVQDIKNPRTIIFDASIEHTEQFVKMMPGAVAIHSGVPKKKRDKLLELVRQGVVRTVVTVDQFNEGIDIPEANVLVFLRSTQSPRIFRQQLGRGLRKLLGKKKVLVLDFVANCERLLFLDELRIRLEEFKKVSRKSFVMRKRERFSVDWGEIVFEERVTKVVELLKLVKLPLTDERLLQYLRNFYQTHGRAPVYSDFRKKSGLASYTIYSERFGGVVPAIIKAGISMSSLTPRQRSSWFKALQDSELLALLKQYKAINGRIPSARDLKQDPTMPTNLTFRFRFGGYAIALKKAGLLPAKYVGLDNDVLLELLRDFFVVNGRAPLARELKATNGLPSFPTLRERFGSFQKALKLAKVPVTSQTFSSKDTPNSKLLAQLRGLYLRLGRAPIARELGPRNDTFTHVTYHRRFGSFTYALIRARIPKKALSNEQRYRRECFLLEFSEKKEKRNSK